MLCKLLASTVALLLTAVAIQTATFPHMQPNVHACTRQDADFIPASPEVLERFQAAIRIPTVSTAPGNYDREALQRLHVLLREQFPLAYATLQVEVVNELSLLFKWPGSDVSLKPVMLASHLDVVPVPDPSVWTVPPFDATVQDGYVWGRGTLDDKQGVVGILEAVTFLIQQGHQPKRTVYLAFGHDEEVEGLDGAKQISKLLQERGVTLEYLLDEGLPIVTGQVPGADKPVALIGTAEKGYLITNISVSDKPGHASMPPAETTIGILASAVARIEANPMPNRFGADVMRDGFEHIATELSLPYRVLMSNLWLFSPVLARILEGKQSTNAAVRTTTAVTMINGGIKANVIPPEVSALMNHRIHPSDSVQAVLDHLEAVIDDPRVTISPGHQLEPSHISPCGPDALGYNAIQSAVMQIFPDVLVMPSLFIANSDTRHYWDLTENIYRFCPSIMGPEDLKRLHGIDERIGVKNYEQIINFYYHLLLNTDEL